MLRVEDLSVRFGTAGGTVHAVDGASFGVDRGETVCLVGESGSGKTAACEALTRLSAAAIDGRVALDGTDLTALDEAALRRIRGDRIGHVFQDAAASLDPVYPVGEQVGEALVIHRDVPREAARDRAVALLDRVGIPDAAGRVDDYPHEFSGGMQQRVAIAAAVAAEPDLLVADEPTTGMDVTVQADVLSLLRDLRAEYGLGMLFVTHDMGVVADVADRVVVMYGGKVMERGPAAAVFDDPAHPYTRALFDCLPGRGDDTRPIEGSPPDPLDPPAGCRFHPRCPHAAPVCRHGGQPRFRDGPTEAACAFPEGVER